MLSSCEPRGGLDALLVNVPVTAPVSLRAQDRPRWRGGIPFLTTALSPLVIAAAFYELRGVDLRAILALLPASPLFWVVFVASYLPVPAADWLIFHRLWGVGPSAFGPLLRKMVYNELLIGYLGEAYFYTWARRHAELEAAPFGAVKDVAILSAMVGNIFTLAMLAIAWPLASATQLGLETRPVVLSLTVVLVTSLAAVLWRRRIFSLPPGQLRFVFAAHLTRILLATGLSGLLWHLVLPAVPLVWWLLLATIRLLISRLPLLPNKDLVFAGVAVFVLGHDVEIASSLALVAGLILLAHLLVGGAFATVDLLQRERAG